MSTCQVVFLVTGRDSGNDFGHLSVPFLEDWICAACNYPTRNTNFKKQILDNRLKLVLLLVIHFFVTPSCITRPGATSNEKNKLLGNYPFYQSTTDLIIENRKS